MKKHKTLYIQVGLFLGTTLATTFAGLEWITGYSVLDSKWAWADLSEAFLYYTLPFLGFLTVHEFGHYFMAKKRKVSVTLPYYIPAWFVIVPSIGTFGAFIRIKELVNTRLKYFDIGVAGPLAGFLVAFFVLIYGYSHLPGLEFLFRVHPEYAKFGADYAQHVYAGEVPSFRLGDSLLTAWIRDTFADRTLLPHENELLHYPFILAGYLGLFFTALNLLPIGQLDGGHILFALIGEKRFNRVSPLLFLLFTFYAGLGFFNVYELQSALSRNDFVTLGNFLLFVYFTYLCLGRVTKKPLTSWILTLGMVLIQLIFTLAFPGIEGYSGFLAFSFILGRFLGVYHPPVVDKKPLNLKRQVIGWLALLIFVLCISPNPFN